MVMLTKEEIKNNSTQEEDEEIKRLKILKKDKKKEKDSLVNVGDLLFNLDCMSLFASSIFEGEVIAFLIPLALVIFALVFILKPFFWSIKTLYRAITNYTPNTEESLKEEKEEKELKLVRIEKIEKEISDIDEQIENLKIKKKVKRLRGTPAQIDK